MRGPFYVMGSYVGVGPGGGENFSQIKRDPPPGFFVRAKRAKASKFARIKICALTFETCRSSDVYNYMIFLYHYRAQE
jgi:hypothetical protein